MVPARVLLIEDDQMVSDVVVRYLEKEGYVVEAETDGRAGLRRALEASPDLIVLDIMLPGIDGLEVCRSLRAQSPVPIIMLTALGEESDRVMGLELGADDYVSKPFSPRELTARVNAVLRRSSEALEGHVDSTPIHAGGLALDLAAHEVRVHDRPVSLTVREFELLAFLMRRPRRVFTREELLEQVWGYSHGDQSTVTVHVRRLREKLEGNPTVPRWIMTVWGVGYRFDP